MAEPKILPDLPDYSMGNTGTETPRSLKPPTQAQRDLALAVRRHATRGKFKAKASHTPRSPRRRRYSQKNPYVT